MVLLGTNVYKTLESCGQSLLTMLQWTKTTSVISKWGTFSAIFIFGYQFHCFSH